MSLRLKTEDAFTTYLTASTAKPSGYVVQAGHRIADLELPAVVVHAEQSEPVVEGSVSGERKVTLNFSIMTPMETSSVATTHRSAFDWLNTALAATTVLSAVTFMGGYPGAEQTGTNDKVMQDGLTYTAFVRP
jgi:type IV secretory pathway TraG/TraD family ATPase VirD4